MHLAPLYVTLGQSEIQYAESGACLVDRDPSHWTIDVPSRECQGGVDRRDNLWFELSLPRCRVKVCALPQPGQTFMTEVWLVARGESDDTKVPVMVKVTVLRHERPFVILGIQFVRMVDDSFGFGPVRIRGELSVHVGPDEQHLVDSKSWRR